MVAKRQRFEAKSCLSLQGPWSMNHSSDDDPPLEEGAEVYTFLSASHWLKSPKGDTHFQALWFLKCEESSSSSHLAKKGRGSGLWKQSTHKPTERDLWTGGCIPVCVGCTLNQALAQNSLHS